MKFNNVFIVIFGIVILDVVGIGLVMLVLLGFLWDIVYFDSIVSYYGVLLVLYVLM